ncbi:hypothetical protein ACFS07_24905 [Undibacterium arcticum]
MDQNTMQLLCELARERDVEQAREALFTGEKDQYHRTPRGTTHCIAHAA